LTNVTLGALNNGEIGCGLVQWTLMPNAWGKKRKKLNQKL